MLKVTFRFSLKITIDHSAEFSLNVLTGANQKRKCPNYPVTYFGAQGHYLNKLRRGPLVNTFVLRL